jgi:hypothetical protein
MRPKIAIVTLATPDIWEYAKYGVLTKQSYSKLHGYDFHLYKVPLDETRPAAWSKLKIIGKHLPFYDWVFWSDADSIIMNPRITLSSLIAQAPEKKMLMTRGPMGKYNTGQWLVRNCRWAADVLEKTWKEVSVLDAWLTNNPWEQQAFINLSEKISGFDSEIHVLPLRLLNSRPAPKYIDLFHDLPGAEYRPKDFIIHFYHTKEKSKRTEGMKKYFHEVSTLYTR